MTTSNKTLLNARVRRADGTITYINKVNANGYSTDSKGPQIPVKRIVFAGKSLKEIAEPFAKGEYVIVQGVAVKLNKRQQRELADGSLDEKALRPDFGRLTIIDPETGAVADGKKVKPKADKKTTGVKAARKRGGDTSTKKERRAAKSEMKDELDMIQSDKIDRKAELVKLLDGSIAGAKTKERRKQLSEAFGMDWKDIKKQGGKGVVKHLGRKDAQSAVDKLSASMAQDAFVKQMPTALKRLLQDGCLTLNRSQIERVLSALDLDVKFYAVATNTLLGNLKLSLDNSINNPKSRPRVKKSKNVFAKASFLSEKEQKRRIKKMKTKLLAPDKKSMREARAHLKAAQNIMADKLNIAPKDIKRGLVVYDKNGTDFMFVASDISGPVFIDKDGVASVYTYSQLEEHFNLTLNPSAELDAAV